MHLPDICNRKESPLRIFQKGGNSYSKTYFIVKSLPLFLLQHSYHVQASQGGHLVCFVYVQHSTSSSGQLSSALLWTEAWEAQKCLPSVALATVIALLIPWGSTENCRPIFDTRRFSSFPSSMVYEWLWFAAFLMKQRPLNTKRKSVVRKMIWNFIVLTKKRKLELRINLPMII